MSEIKNTDDVLYHRILEFVIKNENSNAELRESIYYKAIKDVEKYQFLISDILSFKDENPILKYEDLNFNNNIITYHIAK